MNVTHLTDNHPWPHMDGFQRQVVVPSRRKKWLIDLDSVVIENFPAQVEAVNTKFNTNWKVGDFDTWSTESVIPQEQADYMWGPEVFGSADFHISLPEIPGAVRAVKIIEGVLRDDVFFVTDRRPAVYEATKQWLESRGLTSPLIFSGKLNKAVVAAKIGFDVAVDDAPHNITELALTVNRVYGWSYPYNQGVGIRPNVTWVQSWDEVLEREGRLNVSR